jgi:purine-nucleoside phosphorylase
VFCGVGKVLQVSAAGAVREDFRPGTTMAVTDFINNLGTSPLVGNQDLGTTPFPDMQEAFSQVALSQFINLTADTGMVPRLGTYQANLGPQFETPTEVEAARRNGADAVGMSLVLETIAARAMGADVIAIAVITNAAASVRGHRISHEDVAEVAAFASRTLHAAIQAYAAGLESG